MMAILVQSLKILLTLVLIRYRSQFIKMMAQGQKYMNPNFSPQKCFTYLLIQYLNSFSIQNSPLKQQFVVKSGFISYLRLMTMTSWMLLRQRSIQAQLLTSCNSFRDRIFFISKKEPLQRKKLEYIVLKLYWMTVKIEECI